MDERLLQRMIPRAPNYKWKDFKYYHIFEVFCSMGSAKIDAGITPGELYSVLKQKHPERWDAWTDVERKKERDYVRAILTDYRTGQIKGGRSDTLGLFKSLQRRVWTLPSMDECLLIADRLTQKNTHDALQAASALKGYITSKRPPIIKTQEFASSIEGNQTPAVHLRRERGRIADDFKRSLTSFECEVCNINFGEKYGSFAAGYIEAHHVIPLHQGVRLTRVEDFKAVCPNCHKMLHWKGHRTVEELRAALALSYKP